MKSDRNPTRTQTIRFPLQPEIARRRAIAAVHELQRGNTSISTSHEWLGPYAGRVEWLRHAVSITKGRP